MKNKVLIEEYSIYGEMGEALYSHNSYVRDNDENLRKDIVSNYNYDIFEIFDEESFIEGRIDTLYVGLRYRDVDSPDGYSIVINTYESKCVEIKEEYNHKMTELNKMFGVESSEVNTTEDKLRSMIRLLESQNEDLLMELERITEHEK
ncbi:hypothetical protein [Abyssicoccus albus]|uniref:Uncharacterized protein n=1 Tax=Abyssicoccus albus TaxID=1817405 RepID=A0A3N5BBL0_9BACL|nr:hypothetical protein [Abyssicoccus albus]RPF54787.1 hypothetical protein EDD62_1748 [Abyssicoccus albus]